MPSPSHRWTPWIAAWLALALIGASLMVRLDIAERREAFQAQARRAHGLLSQRAAEHDAILATLRLLGPSLAAGDRPEARLPAVHPRLLAVLRRDREAAWPDPALADAEARSRALGHAVLGPGALVGGQAVLVLAGSPTSFALQLDLRRLLPDAGWPWPVDGSMRATLSLPGSAPWVLQAGRPAAEQPGGLTAGFVFEQPLASPSQPWVLRLQRATGPGAWPWLPITAWSAASALLLWALAARWTVRRERRRAGELQRVAQVASLNSLGELAGGMAHELNQPLAAVLANAQAAQRLLRDDPPELETAQTALAGAVAQARRAADVLSRLRRLVEQPDAQHPVQAVSLRDAAHQGVDLLAPVLQRHGVRVTVSGDAPAAAADPVALEQIIHNLVRNAVQAMAAVPADERALSLHIGPAEGDANAPTRRTAGPVGPVGRVRSPERVCLRVRDTGPGVAPAALPHLFEPFYSTRAGGAQGREQGREQSSAHNGLGLGLSLCERLAQSMGGTLSAHAAPPRGAEFRLLLPRFTDTDPTLPSA